MILLGLGSNIGAREVFIERAHKALAAAGAPVVKASALLETPAMLPPGAPATWDTPYLNQVVEVRTQHSPEQLLRCAKSIEAALGRTDRGRWGPREIDIDLLAYHDEQRTTDALTLPHPGIAARLFVLQPLAEIAPHWRHPLTGLSASEMLR